MSNRKDHSKRELPRNVAQKTIQWPNFDLKTTFFLLSIPIVAESLRGLHGIAAREIQKIGAALARHTGEDEGQTTSHLFTRVAILIQRGLAALLLNRIPDYPSVVISGDV